MTPEQLLAAINEVLAPAPLPQDLEAADAVAKEMYDASFSRVDAVKGLAHGMRFAVMKSTMPFSILQAHEVGRSKPAVRPVAKARDAAPIVLVSDGSSGEMCINGRLVGYATRRPDGTLSFDFHNPSPVRPVRRA